MKALKGDLNDRQDRLAKSLQRKEELSEKLKELDDTSLTLEARAQRLQEILKEEKQTDKQLDKDIQTIRDISKQAC